MYINNQCQPRQKEKWLTQEQYRCPDLPLLNDIPHKPAALTTENRKENNDESKEGKNFFPKSNNSQYAYFSCLRKSARVTKDERERE